MQKYITAFVETFEVEESDLIDLSYQDIPAWDSLGHMTLMAELEDVFDVELDIDDIIDFSSFEVGKNILKKYNVEVEQS
ncbi:MAG: acyl carrier protein [Flavobacteriaceae bacterium]|nr:acyl carrier protein [Flavobacteriaceae bacterium]